MGPRSLVRNANKKDRMHRLVGTGNSSIESATFKQTSNYKAPLNIMHFCSTVLDTDTVQS